MKFLIYLIPFSYVRKFRYYQGIKIFSYLFGELLQQYLFCYLYFGEIYTVKFFLLLALFWSAYEIGYIINDCISIHFETIPTERAPEYICSKAQILIIGRFIIVIFLFFMITTIFSEFSGDLIFIYLSATISIFTIHNLIKSYKFRLLTFIVLGLIRQGFIIGLMSAETSLYIVIVLPFLLIKLFGYLHAKQMTSEDLREDLFLRFIIYLAWGCVLPLFIPLKFMYIYIVLFVNQNKKYLFKKIKILIRYKREKVVS